MHRIVVGATHSKPILINDAKPLLHSCDKGAIQVTLREHGLEADDFEFQNHVTAVIRAIRMASMPHSDPHH